MGGPEALEPLAPLFASPDIRTLFHAAEYDLYVLKRDCGFRFNSLFDTMICAQLLGYSGVGLAALIERHFDVKLPKDEQRSDWSARPLRGSQLTYAAADVRFLIRVAERLEKELRKVDRLSWAEDEFRTLEKREWPDREFDRLGYLKIKGARALDPQCLSLLRELYLVRDKRAREIDRPAFKVLGNRTLLEIAQKQPESEKELGEIKGVTDLILRRFGRDIMGAVERGKKRKHGPIPKSVGTGRRRMDRRTERRLAALKKWRGDQAKALSLDPGVMCPNATLESIAFEDPHTAAAVMKAGVKPWFGRSFGSEIAQLLRDLDAEGA
jgi:ribonuclease D